MIEDSLLTSHTVTLLNEERKYGPADIDPLVTSATA